MIDPGTYQIAGMADMNKSHGKGFNFGTERNGMKNVLKNNLHTDPNIPGPASYRDHEVYKTDSRFKYNTLGRCDPKEQRFKVKDNRIISNFPGPGAHNPTITDLDNSGGKGGSQRYLLSRNMSARTTRINPPHKGSGVSRDKVPGPGNYDDKFGQTLTGDGKYTLSRHKNSGCRSFGKAVRDTLGIRSKTPGPGAYDACSGSDFYQGQ
jgi:nitrate reductase beta subunit